MDKNYRILVFGKAGCDKCDLLKGRLDKLLTKPDYADFDKVHCDLETEDGLVTLCQTECINPQRIPAFMVLRRDQATGRYTPVPNQAPLEDDPVCGGSRLYLHLGLQTDYSVRGHGGVITPAMIESVLARARSA
jgi:hypothetical protein